MDQFYYIVEYCGCYKKLTRKQYLSFCAAHSIHGFKVLKTDYNALEKSLKGVILPDKTKYIFNRLHAARKTAAAY